MSGPYRVEMRNGRWGIEGPSAPRWVWSYAEGALEQVEALNAAHAAGLAASGREAELVKALEWAVGQHDYRHLDMGVGTKLPDGKRWLELRALLTPTEDREYQIAVEKLMKEPG